MSTGDYNCGLTSGTATSGPIDLQAGLPFTLTAKVYMGTESSASYDQLRLRAIVDGQTVVLWEKPSISAGTWFPIQAKLNAMAGKSTQLQWHFDTVDSIANTGVGVYIDDINIVTSCSPLTCSTAVQCNDGLNATTDICAGGTCTYSF